MATRLPKPRSVVRRNAMRGRRHAQYRHTVAPWQDEYFRGRTNHVWLPGAKSSVWAAFTLNAELRERLAPLTESQRFVILRETFPDLVSVLVAHGVGTSHMHCAAVSRTSCYRIIAVTCRARRKVADWLAYVLRRGKRLGTLPRKTLRRIAWYRECIRRNDGTVPFYVDGGWNIRLPADVAPPITLPIHRWEGDE